MKKASLVSLLISLLLILFGCSSERPIAAAITTATPEPIQIPEHVARIYQAYKKVERENNFAVQLSGKILPPTKDSSFFTFYVQEVPAQFSSGSITFYVSKGSDTSKSFSTYFTDGFGTAGIKEFITMTLLAVDKNLNLAKAKEETGKIVTSFTGKGHSSLYCAPEYTIFINDAFMNGLEVNAVYNQDINVAPDKNEYQKMTFEEIRAPLNAFEKVVIEGTVVRQYTDYFQGLVQEEKIIVESDGYKYIASFQFDKLPVQFDVGQEYKLYGACIKAQETGYACIGLDFFEKVDVHGLNRENRRVAYK